MDSAEIKLELFRKIDKLSDADLKRVYQMLLSLLNSSTKYKLSEAEKNAVERAVHISKKNKMLSNRTVMNEAKGKYSKLKFK